MPPPLSRPPPLVPPVLPVAVHCAKCGSVLKQGAKFCSKCGTQTTVGQATPALSSPPKARTGRNPFLIAVVSGILALLGRGWANGIIGGGSRIDMNFMYIVLVFGVAFVASRRAARAARSRRS